MLDGLRWKNTSKPHVSGEPRDLSLIFHAVTCTTVHFLCLIKFHASYRNPSRNTNARSTLNFYTKVTISLNGSFEERGSQRRSIFINSIVRVCTIACTCSFSAKFKTFQSPEGARVSSYLHFLEAPGTVSACDVNTHKVYSRASFLSFSTLCYIIDI